MNLRQIEILRAVVSCKSTVQAAKLLNLSQPAVSSAVKQLERSLGFTLFNRVNNRLVPTAEAQALYQSSANLFEIQAAFETCVRELKENGLGRLRILASPPLGYSVMPKAIHSFTQVRPDVRISFDIQPFETVVRSITRGDADIGFVFSFNEDIDLASEVFFSGSLVCIMPPSHPLVRKDVICPADLRDFPFIAIEQEMIMGAYQRNIFEEAGEPYMYSIAVRYCHTACLLVEAGVGVSLVDPLSPLFSGPFRLSIRPFTPTRQIDASVLLPGQRSTSDSTRLFIQHVRLVAKQVAEKLI